MAASKGIIGAFKDLVTFIPKLVELNAKNRQKIRDAVGTVADELIRGLNLVQSRIEGARVLARSSEKGARAALETYMAETTGKLFAAFSEFKICRGLRETRDEFVRPFAAAKASVRLNNVQKIDSLLYELEHDEKMIIDEVGPLLAQLARAAKGPTAKFLALADDQLQQIEKRKANLRRLAREIHIDL